MFKPGLQEEQLEERSLVLQKDLTVSNQEEMEGRDPKTQQQKLSEAFIHLSLPVYHHNLLSRMFKHPLQWVVLSPRPPLLSFWLIWECGGMKSLLLFPLSHT